MEHYQMLELGSSPGDIARDDRYDQVKHVFEFNGHVEATNKIITVHDKSETSYFHGHTAGQAIIKSGTKKSDHKVKMHKFAFQTRSHVDVLDDGYRWRKYGQKIVKNNQFPRSYYKCTFQGCIVKKQIQRVCQDEEIVVTTYEGIHTHFIDKNNSAENYYQLLKHIQTSSNSATTF